MITYQDYLKQNGDIAAFLSRLIADHNGSAMVRTALDADLYDRRRNRTINEYVRRMYTLSGIAVQDYTASNNKLASNFFNRLNTQRATYSLGNGVTFSGDGVKERLGLDFDTRLAEAGRFALIHGVSFVFFNVDRIHVFPLTEFARFGTRKPGRSGRVSDIGASIPRNRFRPSFTKKTASRSTARKAAGR